MSREDTPKLYMDKPKKALLKQQASSSSSMAPLTSTGCRPPPPTYRPPKESFARRYKFLWPMLLTVNFSMGGMQTSELAYLCNQYFGEE
ncbi:PREDICTED: uncharacterized protein LOC109190238 isoform X2 [Ipomoea nil]|uniref:uncharacterized protein LOC109190238 isoform X2 n=1 Tax=Ipomoea nil TaxID=35883 RepID=UPI000901414D|nr:PREDICTED: uncharacterized protein LOC109190238 isoform X2 [Ipomoea nil]